MHDSWSDLPCDLYLDSTKMTWTTLFILAVLPLSCFGTDLCQLHTHECTKQMLGVEDVFTKGDFSSLVDDDELLLNCSDSYLGSIKSCMNSIDETCDGQIEDHPKLFFSAYTYICRRQNDFIDADYCFHSEDFSKVLINCAKDYKAEDSVCRKFPMCLQRKVAQLFECTATDGRIVAELSRSALSLKYNHCSQLLVTMDH